MLNDEVGLCKIHDICGDITEEEHSNGCVCDTTTLPTPFFIITSSSTSSQPTVRPWRQSISESREREDPQLIILVRHIKFLWPWAYLLSSLFPSIRLGNLITSTTIGEWPFNASSYLNCDQSARSVTCTELSSSSHGGQSITEWPSALSDELNNCKMFPVKVVFNFVHIKMIFRIIVWLLLLRPSSL